MTNKSDLILYTSPDGQIKVDVFLYDETVWLTQKKLAELFGVNIRTISEHLKNIFSNGELEEQSVIRKFRNTASDGKLVKKATVKEILTVRRRANEYKRF